MIVVEHEPVWHPAMLNDGPRGYRPGYLCMHVLENGSGRCGGNVFELHQAVGKHACVVPVRSGIVRRVIRALTRGGGESE